MAKGMYEAFGEIKSLKQWASDTRSQVKYGSLKERVRAGLPIESAMIFVEGLQTLHWAFGERKRLTHWLRDPRCSIPGSILKARLESGELLDSALRRDPSEPLPRPEDDSVLRKPGETEEEAMKRLERRYGVLKLTLFGETKTVSQWRHDRRCEVSYPTLVSRLSTGWPHDPSVLKRLPNETPLSRRFTAMLSSGVDLGAFPTIRSAEHHRG